MTEKNIFVYNLFLSLNISDFILFFCKNCIPLWTKLTLFFPATPLSKLRSCQAPLFKIWYEVQPLPSSRKEGRVHTMVGFSLTWGYSLYIITRFLLLLFVLYKCKLWNYICKASHGLITVKCSESKKLILPNNNQSHYFRQFF